MQEYVTDASVGIAWVCASQATEATSALMGEATIVVPALWSFECANTLLMLLRRGKVTKGEWAEARQWLGRLNVDVDLEGGSLALTGVSLLAAQHGLTVYDATYLELAQRRGLPLASRDSALNKAAKKCGVKVLL